MVEVAVMVRRDVGALQRVELVHGVRPGLKKDDISFSQPAEVSSFSTVYSQLEVLTEAL